MDIREGLANKIDEMRRFFDSATMSPLPEKCSNPKCHEPNTQPDCEYCWADEILKDLDSQGVVQGEDWEKVGEAVKAGYRSREKMLVENVARLKEMEERDGD